jgi:mannose-1-phosphate guanylyltransferase
MTPDGSEGQFGWIVPRAAATRAPAPIRFFVEKPKPRIAAALAARGGLRNSFLLVSNGEALLALFRKTRPALLASFLRTVGTGNDRPAVLEKLYDTMEAEDFSRDVLQRATADLEVLAVPECGWRDLGTPSALADWLFHRMESAHLVE